jgi:integrase
MGRKPNNSHAPGIYNRGGVFWLRFTADGKQCRVSLKTDDYATAVINAEAVRKNPSVAKPAPLEGSWDKLIEDYINKKCRLGAFTKNTSQTVRYACQAFGHFVGNIPLDKIKPDSLQDFYEFKFNQGAESTARGYATKAHTFLSWYKIEMPFPKFRGHVASRDVVVPRAKMDELIADCPRTDLLFVLLCGFHAGMRKDEIIHARPAWFDLNNNRVTIPAQDGDWTSKSKRKRQIPLSRQFQLYFRALELSFPNWRQLPWILHPEAKGKRYRWDFRRPFTDYMASKGLLNVSPHTMRHSFITYLAENGQEIAIISALSGDRIKTLETNYLHVKASADDLSDILEGITPEAKMRDVFSSVLEDKMNSIPLALRGSLDV